MREIVQKEKPILRETAKSVPIDEITSPKIRRIIRDMKEALDAQEDGVAIAAPQIGVPLRIFLVSKKVFEPPLAQASDASASEKTNIPKMPRDMVFINPNIIKLSKKKEWVEEGCLSVRWLYGQVQRANNATVRAHDENGKEFTRGAGGLLAQIFQHETDHLDGILFIDKARNVQEIPPPDKKNN